MLLADLGNTRGKFYALVDGMLSFIGYWDYDKSPKALLAPYMGETLVFASVTQVQHVHTLYAEARVLAIALKQIETEAYGHGVINGYQQPKQLGVDRWLALIGARLVTQAPCMIVDVGTAVTIDVMDEFGQHKGGWILPGFNLMTESLLTNTSALTQISAQRSTALANQTAQGITNGVLAAVLGAIERAMQAAQQALKTQFMPQLLLTGGGSAELEQSLSVPYQHQPNLVLMGLAQCGGEPLSSLC